MKNWLITIALFFIYINAYTQNRSGLKGTVIDSLDKQPIELATVSLSDFRDSTFISYTSTIKNGSFSLKGIPSQKDIVLIISIMGYKDFVKIINIPKEETLDLGTIMLSLKHHLLNQIIVSSQIQSVVINKDTVSFNVASFKVRPNAVAEELLKKLPGIQIDNQGKITFNGKNISKVKVDGKEFFSNDPRIATQNIDVELLDKVQVYDDRENDPDHLIEDDKVNKIINLKFKNRLKKSVFGKIYAGGGSRDRYESGFLVNTFRDTLQMSFIGIGNNLNKTGFSYHDLSDMGGFGRSGSNIYDGSINTGGQSFGGIERVLSGGVNINNDYGEKLKLNLLYFHSNSNKRNNTIFHNEQFLQTDTLSNDSKTSDNYSNYKHNINALIQWKPDSLQTIRYEPKLIFSQNKMNYAGSSISGNTSGKISLTDYKTKSKSPEIQFQQNLNYHKRLGKKESSFSINHGLSINKSKNPTYTDNIIEAFSPVLQPEQLYRFNDNVDKNFNVSLNANIRYPITQKLIMGVEISGNYYTESRLSLLYDKDNNTGKYDQFLREQSSDLDRDQFTFRATPQITYKFNNRVHLNIDLYNEWLKVYNKFNFEIPDINKKYFNLLPSVRLTIHDLTLNYSSSIQQPSTYNLQPVTLQFSQLNSFTGNPYLTPSKQHNSSLNFNKYISSSQINFYMNVSATLEENAVVTVRETSTEGVYKSTSINKNGRNSFNTYMGFVKSFKQTGDWRIHTNSNLYAYQNKNPFLLNNDNGSEKNSSIGYNGGIGINWKDKIELSPSYSISYNNVRYQNVNYDTNNFYRHSIDSRYTIRLPKKFYIEGNYRYNYNPQAGEGFRKSFHLLNTSISLQMMKKDRGEIKLSCYDILNQAIANYRYGSGASITDYQFSVLNRYFLLTYLIKFNKTTTK